MADQAHRQTAQQAACQCCRRQPELRYPIPPAKAYCQQNAEIQQEIFQQQYIKINHINKKPPPYTLQYKEMALYILSKEKFL
jgi:hypothetical protein